MEKQRIGGAMDYQVVRTGIDEQGKSFEERHWYPYSFGKLKGLGLWLQLTQQRYQERLLDFRRPARGYSLQC